jgi:hypothetical protein
MHNQEQQQWQRRGVAAAHNKHKAPRLRANTDAAADAAGDGNNSHQAKAINERGRKPKTTWF